MTWNEIADFAEARLDFLRSFFPDLTESPSHDTIRRFFCLISTSALEGCYRDWAHSMRKSMETDREEGYGQDNDREKNTGMGRQIAIDGKTICSAMNERAEYDSEGFRIPKGKAGAMEKLHLVSAFLVDQCLSIGQERVDCKENEIVAIPRLLDSLELSQGDVITIDLPYPSAR